MRPKYDIAVMDWGIGGLSVYNEIRRLGPGYNILYFSDSGFTPYGKTSSRHLTARLDLIFEKFFELGIRKVVVACNAASTVLPPMQKRWAKRGVKVTGVIDSGVRLIRGARVRRVGVIGGKRTIVSGSFSKPFRSSKSVEVLGRVAQPLSALIEAGDLSGPRLESALKKILRPLRDRQALLLACTHYPAVEKEIKALLPTCKMLDPSRATAEKVIREMPRKPGRGRTVFWTTGDPRMMKRSGLAAFKVKLNAVKVRF